MLRVLQQIVQEISEISDIDHALDLLASRVQNAMRVDCCSVYLAQNLASQSLTLTATYGLAKEAIGKVKIDFSEGLVGLIAQREEPINVSDAQSHSRFKPYPKIEEEPYHGFLGAPIIHRRQVLGVIAVQQKQTRRFSEDEEAFLVTLAAQVALEVAHAEARGLLTLAGTDPAHSGEQVLRGVPGSSGLAIGKALAPYKNTQNRLRDYPLSRSTQKAREISRFRTAVQLTRVEIQQLANSMQGNVPGDIHAIFQVYEQLLDAQSLGNEVEAKISTGWNAASALKMVVEHYREQFRSMDDRYMQERAVDIQDLGNRVFAHLMSAEPVKKAIQYDVILVAEDVTASMLAEYPREHLKGVISMHGSNNSHAAILARGIGIPAVMGLTDVPLELIDGKDLLIDGYTGEVVVAPEAKQLQRFQQLIDEERDLNDIVAQQMDLPAQTLDGVPIQLLVNAGLAAEFEVGKNSTAEGVGLFRTEVPFMQRERFPSEQEQLQLYRDMLSAYQGQSVTMRTLDVGGDKPLPYFPIQEENPFLGWRGIRITLDHPEIFLVQIRAMLRASIGLDNLKIMLPMVTNIAEVREAKRLIRQAFYEVSDEASRAKQVVNKPKLGVMLEVPTVLFMMPQLAQLVDFFSVGTNDLTQYLLAVDRNNARVADLYDSYQPAVLNALQQLVQEADQLQTPITVCGELAGDPVGAVLLLAMGYRKLSVNSRNLGRVKWVVRNVDLPKAQLLLQQALSAEHSFEVLELINQELERLGLGGLVRAGK